MEDMKKLAERAVEAAKFWKLDLDYSAESLEPADQLMHRIYLLNMRQPLPEEILVSTAELYGAYVGEVLLRCGLKDLGFAWAENEEGCAGIEKEDFRAEPVTKVYKRITLGPEHGLTDFFEVVFGLAVGAVDLDDPRMRILREDVV